MKFASARNLTALFDYLRTRGVPASDVADRASIASITGGAGSVRIPALLPIEILERCAVRLDEPLFGLKIAQQLDAKSLGPISLFWRYAPTLRYSNRFISRILHIHYEGMAISLTVDDEEAGFVHAMDLELRTLQRRLASEGFSFQAMLCEGRRRVIAASLLGERRPVLSELAARTGYSEASAVSRFLRTRSPDLRRAPSTHSGGAVRGDPASLPDTHPGAGGTQA